MALISDNVPYYPSKDRSLDLGYLSLNEDEILFEFINIKKVLRLQISEIENILKKSMNNHDYVSIFTHSGEKYSFELLEKKFGKFITSKKETNRFYDLIFTFKFKEIAKKSREKYPIVDSLKEYESKNHQSRFCYDCPESIRIDVNFCDYCRKRIKILENLQDLGNDLKKNDIDEKKDKEYTKTNRDEKHRDDTEKFRKIIEISPLIRLGDLQKYLNLDVPDLCEKIIKWSKEYGLIIEGDYLITNCDSLQNFMSTLNRQYLTKELVNEKRNSNEKKMCSYCNNLIELSVKICPYCGSEKPIFNFKKKN